MLSVLKLLNLAIFCSCLVASLNAFSALAATSIPFTVNVSKVVNVTGAPRIAVDVGGVTRYANYASGSGTSALTFTYAMVAGDVDLDGVTVSSPIDLNGGTIKDLTGNDLSPLTFTLPNTTNVKVNYPSLGMDFIYDADGRYTLNGTVYNDLSSFLTAAGGSFSRSSVGTYYDSAGVLQAASSGTPRFDHDPVTHAQKGILIEESRANFILRSSEFDDTYWTRHASTLTPNFALGPDNIMSADKFIPNAGGGSAHRIVSSPSAISVTSGTAYTGSVYIKSGGYQYVDLYLGYTNFPSGNGATFDLTNGTISRTFTSTSPKIDNIGNGWYRCSITVTASTTGNSNTAFFIVHSVDSGTTNIATTADGTSSYLIWGAQYEAGSYPTSYIPTTTTAVTRAADALTVPTGSWYNISGFTATTEFSSYATSGSPRQMSISDGTLNNYVQLLSTVGGLVRGNKTLSGLGSSSSGPSYNPNTYYKTALAVDAASIPFAANGNLYTNTLSRTLPTVATLYVGALNNSAQTNGWIKSFKYYPYRVTDAQLQLLSQ